MANHRPVPSEPDGNRAVPGIAVRLAAEFAGTLLLTFVAVGADAAASVTGGKVTDLARAIAPALMVMAWIYAMGDRSGAHLNPAVTLAFTLRGLFPARLAPAYATAQLCGALSGALVVRWLLGDAVAAGVTQPHGIEPATALAIEAILTAILVTVVLGTADRASVVGPNAAMAVGATIALCGLVALPLEGASMNPARSTGPAVVAGTVGDLWIYWVGPTIGAVIAVLAARLLHGPESREQESVEAATGEGGSAVARDAARAASGREWQGSAGPATGSTARR